MSDLALRYAIHDEEGYWFNGFEDGEPVFVNARWRAQHFADGKEADAECAVLAQMCGDSGMAVGRLDSNMIGINPKNIVIPIGPASADRPRTGVPPPCRPEHQRNRRSGNYGDLNKSMTREIAFAAAKDLGDKRMRDGNRKVWSLGDYRAACDEFARLWPPPIADEPPQSAQR